MPNIRTTSHVCPQYAALASNPKRNPTAAAICGDFGLSSRGAAAERRGARENHANALLCDIDDGLGRNPSDRQDCMFLLKLLLPHIVASRAANEVRHHGRFFQRIERRGTGRGQQHHHEPVGPALDRECIGMVLAAQQCAPTFWAQPKTLQSFNAILNLIVDERPKIRKSSHEAIRTLLRGGHARYLANNIVSCWSSC